MDWLPLFTQMGTAGVVLLWLDRRVTRLELHLERLMVRALAAPVSIPPRSSDAGGE